MPQQSSASGGAGAGVTAGAGQDGCDCHVHVFNPQAPVRSGHYTPADHPLHAIEALAATLGVHHLVLVQPSVYGTDHRVLLQALQGSRGRHRGVAVLDASVSEAELDTLHAAGVRGVRFNRVSPAGHAGDPAAALMALAPRLRARRWHVQWYVHAAQLAPLAQWQQQTGLDFVLDHLAGLHAGLPAADPAWLAVQQLADAGAWIKLSGWYRLGAASASTSATSSMTTPAAAPAAANPALLDTLASHIQRLAPLFASRLLWGSDWPHTGLPNHQVPVYADTLAPVRAAMGDAALPALLRDNPRELYFKD